MGSSPFTLTTVITIVPRYILVNKLPFTIRIGQHMEDNKISLGSNKRLCYNFKKETEPADKKITIGDIPWAGIKEDLEFSCPFLLEDIGDFQIVYKCLTGKDKSNPKWYEPSTSNNYMRSIHVSIVSQDEATLFVFFQMPEMPEYSITNNTLDEVRVRVKGTKV